MDAKTAYNFLKPSLEKLNDQDKKKLSKMIWPDHDDPGSNNKKKKYDPVMSKAHMKRLLMQSHFKSRV